LPSERPDLSKSSLLWLLACAVLALALTLFLGGRSLPGSTFSQSAGIAGTLALLTPLVFFLLKRTGFTQSPPAWFVAHVVFSTIGTLLILVHVAGGQWFSAPGLVLLALLFLVVQGTLSRVFVSPALSHLFARSSASFNFTAPLRVDTESLGAVVAAKVDLLEVLSPGADEALFSPTLGHWLRRPRLAFRYQRLVEEEYELVGARQRAGMLLRVWRRAHMLVALLFFSGLLAHVIVVLFFAGYAAGPDDVYWWHITEWG